MKTNNMLNLIKTTDITFIVQCYKFTLNDGTTMAFTTNQRDIIFKDDPFTIYRNNCQDTTVLSQTNTLSIDNAETSVLIDQKYVKIQDLENGKFNKAKFIYFEFDTRMDRFMSNTNPKTAGVVGDISRKWGSFKFELRARTAEFGVDVTVSSSPTCRHKFGDQSLNSCRKDLTGLTLTTTILSKISDGSFSISENEDNDIYGYGTVKFLSGKCEGIETTIKTNTDKVIFLRLATIYEFESGDQIILTRGCNKTLQDCIKYNNVINMGAHPYLPGVDKMTSGA